CATKTITTSGTFAISFASGYSIPTTAKQTAWDGAVSAKHTHSNKSVLDGISSTKVSHWDSAYGWYALMTTDEETADGIINKWNEVVSFLANIAQTDTLSGIVDGINKSISDEGARAKKAEGVNASGISANKTSITTLQGYFTSGSAKKALQLTNARKLWGNSFNGTADINGSIIVPDGKYISIGNIKMEYDATNKALKITNTTTNEVANLYTSGGVSAYGVGTSSSSGGGLNGSVKAYADAIRLTTENLSEIASAYSVAKLYSEIQNVASAVPSISVSVPTGGNALTGATYDASTGVITFAKGTFLTSHQSLDGYVNNITTSGTGNAITSVTKSGKTVTFTKGATFLTSHQSLSAYLKSADAANTYLKLSGGAMTGNISYKGSKNTYDMIRFVDNNVDIYGNGICIGGGGLTIIGGGESASEVLKQHTNGGDENMIVANDAAIDFFSNMNSGWDSRKAGSFDTSGYWNGVGFKKNNSNDNYVLTGGGGHKAISTLSVSYASSAGSANSVAWSNVSGRPTKVSQFTNDSNYATQSWVTGKGYLTSHQDISGKVNRTGDYLDTDSDRWWISNSEFGINLHNSDIVGVNSIYISDVSNGPEESISFKRSNGNYDTLRMADGVIWFGTDYALNKTINEYQILHTNNIRITGKSNGFIDMSAGGVIKQAYIYAIGSIDGYESYPDGRTTSINDYDKGLNRLFLTHSTSSLPASQRPLGKDGHILHFGWDNSSGWDAQLAISANGDNPYIAIRAQYSGTWRNWYGAALLKCTNYISGNGGLIVERTDKNLDTYIGVSNGTYDIRLMIGSGNVNRGIYDVVRDNWMLYRDSSTNIYMNGSVLATGGITAYSSSDIRLKQDLRKLDYFGIIKAMGGTFGFAWKKDNTRSIGWIAQHVLCNPHLKDIVETDENGYYKINYWSPKLIATAFGAIEQVGDEISRLKARVVFLESEVQRLSGKQDGNNKKRLDNKNINLLN
ncbi:tail fiber domain-containing protein, partial [Prevotella sp. AM23-5]